MEFSRKESSGLSMRGGLEISITGEARMDSSGPVALGIGGWHVRVRLGKTDKFKGIP